MHREKHAVLRDSSYAMVILDEFNIALQHEYVGSAEVLSALALRPPMQHVVMTGRGARPELMEAADLVTETKQVKHPFRQGSKRNQVWNFNWRGANSCQGVCHERPRLKNV